MVAPSPTLVGVQEEAWRSREERMQRIVKAWEVRAQRTVPVVRQSRKAQWPAQWPSRRALPKDDVETIANGRAAGLSKYCRGKMVGTEAFYVVDLGCVEKLYRGFCAAMPRVRPFYAVKCFPNDRILATLASLGAGFDCASKREVQAVLPKSTSIIFANPCKRPSDIEFLVEQKIRWTTFDSVSEVEKIGKGVGLVLRIRADDPQSKLPFGSKYGALETEIPTLLEAARSHQLKVVGVSFHVGSGARTADAYRAAIEAARQVPVDDWEVLDIGGGMCGDFDEGGEPRVTASGDETLPSVVNAALEEFFPLTEFPKLTVIAEPGRYFAEASAALCAKVIGKRQRSNVTDFWIADGVYGAFNAILYDAWLPHAVHLPSEKKKKKKTTEEEPPEKKIMTSVFGPTCDSLDMVFHDVPAEDMDVGSWLLFPNCGAYTLAGATNFNGIPATEFPVYYVRSESMAMTPEDHSLTILYGRRPPAEIVRYFD